MMMTIHILALGSILVSLVSSKCIDDNWNTIENSETFTSKDGCNMCVCRGDEIICTDEECDTLFMASKSIECANGKVRGDAKCGGLIGNQCPEGSECTFTPPYINDVGTCCYIEPPCSYFGSTFLNGDSFPDFDGCNTCKCDNGTIGCTDMICECANGQVPDAICGGFSDLNCPKHSTCSFKPAYFHGVGICCYDSPGRCSYDGAIYTIGKDFLATDGCNMCTCTDRGVICTSICAPTCVYEGVMYSSGDRFKITDGCNECTCTNDGQLVCTNMTCEPTCRWMGKKHFEGDTIMKPYPLCQFCACRKDQWDCRSFVCPHEQCVKEQKPGECCATCVK